MDMIKTIYLRAVKVLLKKPFALWGISLLNGLLSVVVWVTCGAVPLLAICINLLLSTSMTMVYLHGYRGEGVKCVHLFDCFKDGAVAKRTLGGMLWHTLWIFLWGLIPFVGFIFVIIRTYQYRLTPYILVTEPDVAPTEAIKVSSARTKGFKGKMFLADLLVAVAYLVVLLVLGVLARIPFIGGLFSLISTLFSICYAVLQPLFLGLVQSAFYEEITASLTPASGETTDTADTTVTAGVQ